ncbi:MAG: hypothetical protein ACWA5K_08925 [bacterium]
MKLIRFFIVAAFSLCLGTGTLWAAEEQSPYVMPKKEFKKSIKRIAVIPLQVAQVFSLDEKTQALITELFEKELDKQGFEVIPSAVFADIKTEMSGQVGGLKNPDGSWNIPKFKAVADHSQREMMFRHEFDAFVAIKVTNVRALFSADKAYWDGIEHKVKSSGDGFFASLSGREWSGHIWASSVELLFFDKSERLLFGNRGGIEPIMERKGEALAATDSSTWFQDEKKIKKAVKLAAKPL